LLAISRIGCLAIVTALILQPLLARAEDDGPIVSIKTKHVKIEVNIEPALRRFAALYAALVSEAKTFSAQNQKEAPWTFERSYRLRVSAPPYASVLADSSRFTGGAHPNSWVYTLLWDTHANRPVEMEMLFRETRKDGPTTTTLAKLVRGAIVEEKKRRDFYVEDPATDQWLEPIRADFSTLGAPSLAPSTLAGRASGITFHFSLYAVGPYAEGNYTAFLPLSAIEPYLTDQAKQIFGGERPKSDEDE